MTIKKKKTSKMKKKKIQNLLKQAVSLQDQKDFVNSEPLLQEILSMDPKHAGAYHCMALVAKEFNEFKTACSLMLTSIQLGYNNAESHYNYAVILGELKLHDLAIESYQHAVAIDGNMGLAWYNLAYTYFKKHQYKQAKGALKKLLMIPHHSEKTYSNIAQLYLDMGELDESNKICSLTLDLYPENQDVLWTSLNAIQRQHTIQVELNTISRYLKKNLTLNYSMRITIYKAIAEWQMGKFKACQQSIDVSKQWLDGFEPNLVNLSLLSYRNFIQELLIYRQNNPSIQTCHKNIYMVGDSHSLSNTHQVLSLNQQHYLAQTRLCIGCKTFHLTAGHPNTFKKSFNDAIESIPDSSPVILMFGEIDCRATEGVLPAFLKGDKGLSVMIQEQVEAYVTYALKQTSKKNFDVYFYGVPAPRLLLDVSDENMEILKNIVYIFNQYLQYYALQGGCKFINIYQLTVGEHGLSDGRYHIDDFHLLPKCIEAADLLFISKPE